MLVEFSTCIFHHVSLPTAERGRESYDLPYQNAIRKYEDDLEH